MIKKIKDYFFGELLKDKNILQTAKLAILFELTLFAIGLTLIISIYTLYLGHISVSLRALSSIFFILGLLYITKLLNSDKYLIHTLIILTAVSIYSNAFYVMQSVDFSTIALLITGIIFAFYYLNLRWSFFYTLFMLFPLLAVMYLNSIGYSWTSVVPDAISPSEQALSLVIVLLLIIYLLMKFQRANEAFSLHLTKSNKTLQDAKDSADEMSRLKTTFLANMSHEIRTPINGIMGISQIILTTSDDVEVKKMVQMQLESSNRLLNTITSILKLSKMESENERLELARVDILKMLDTTVDLLRPLAENKKILLNTQYEDDEIICYATEDILYQIFNNIVGNGIKFTDEGHVLLKVRKSGRKALIEISDTGIGIAEDFLPKIFNAFEQESGGLSRDYEGSGLGLSISQKYIELIGGELKVRSEKGRGTTFTLLLPLLD